MTRATVTIGFIPLLDSASLVVAAQRGFAREQGLHLELVRETSWANIRDRTIVGHFDAAHMLGPMVVASTLGIGHLRFPMIAPCALGYGGNAITVSARLWARMRDCGALPGGSAAVQGAALRAVAVGKRHDGDPLTFGIVYPFSCHNYELRYWLAACGIDPDRDVQLVVIPPQFLVDAMRAGQIDGFCVGEPWNSVAVRGGVGVIVTTGAAIWPRCAEKVLGCRGAWANECPEVLAALVRAVHGAAEWCERSENRCELAQLLAPYLGTPVQLLQDALGGRLALLPGAPAQHVDGFFAAAREHATFPFISHAMWFYTQMVRWGQIAFATEHLRAVRASYRPDLYRRALTSLAVEMPESDARGELLFDGQMFDSEQQVGDIGPALR